VFENNSWNRQRDGRRTEEARGALKDLVAEMIECIECTSTERQEFGSLPGYASFRGLPMGYVATCFEVAN
jgi:hypothetical protein